MSFCVFSCFLLIFLCLCVFLVFLGVFLCTFVLWRHSGRVVSALASQQEVVGSILGPAIVGDLFCCVFGAA